MKPTTIDVISITKMFLTITFSLAVFPIANIEGASLFPGPIPTLIDLYSNAELIVHAEVVKTEMKAGQLSHLKVISVIKPDKRKVPNEFEVFIQFGSHWPRPFKANSKTITFLRFDKALKMYVPISNRTGLDVDEKSLGKFYVQQFAKLPDILGTKQPRKQLQRKVEWYVDLSLLPQTRSQGAFGLSALWYRSRKAKLLTDEESHAREDILTKVQKDAICRQLAKETPNNTASLLMEILKDFPSGYLDHYLIQSFKRSLMFEESIPGLGNDIPLAGFRYLPQRLGIEIPPELQTKYEDFRKRRSAYISNFVNRSVYSESEMAKARDELIRLWRDFAKSFLGIPKLANAKTFAAETSGS